MSERSDISLIRCPGIRGTLGAGVGEVEDTAMMGGGVIGLAEGVAGLLRGLLEDARDERGEEDGRMGAFLAREAFREEALVLRGMVGTRDMFR